MCYFFEIIDSTSSSLPFPLLSCPWKILIITHRVDDERKSVEVLSSSILHHSGRKKNKYEREQYFSNIFLIKNKIVFVLNANKKKLHLKYRE